MDPSGIHGIVMIETLIKYDKQLFRLINSDWSNGFFDWLMPWMRNSDVWYPLYLFLVVLVAVNCWKQTWWWLLFAIATVTLTDLVSSGIIKEQVWRLRPCNDPAYSGWIHILVGYRPQSSSFTSSHAANHFGIAMFLYLTLRRVFGKWVLLFFLWAGMISLAQVYVGVHYPIDITAGAAIGILIGYLSGRTYNKAFGLSIPI